MTNPLALCLEDLDAVSPRRFLRCCALPEGSAGLRLDHEGAVSWEHDQPDMVSLFAASASDPQLLVYRGVEAPAVGVLRAQRQLEVPARMRSVLLDGDELRIAGRRFRIHIHGFVEAARPPVYVEAAAKGVALLATTMALGCSQPDAVPSDAGSGGAATTSSAWVATESAPQPDASATAGATSSSSEAPDACAPAASSAAAASSAPPAPKVLKPPVPKPPLPIRNDTPF